MPITSQKVIEDSPQSDGSRFVRYEFTFGNGEVIKTARTRVPIDLDTAADMLYQIPIRESSRALKEINDAISRVMEGEDSLVVAQSPVHTTNKRIAKGLIRWMVRERDPYITLKMESLMEYIKVTYTPTQIRNFLDISPGQLSKLNRKYNAIITNKVDLTTADLQEVWL